MEKHLISILTRKHTPTLLHIQTHTHTHTHLKVILFLQSFVELYPARVSEKISSFLLILPSHASHRTHQHLQTTRLSGMKISNVRSLSGASRNITAYQFHAEIV